MFAAKLRHASGNGGTKLNVCIFVLLRETIYTSKIILVINGIDLSAIDSLTT